MGVRERPSDEVERRWQAEAAEQVRSLLERTPSDLDSVVRARERARALLPQLSDETGDH